MEVGVPPDGARRGRTRPAAGGLVEEVAEHVEQEENGHDVEVREEALQETTPIEKIVNVPTQISSPNVDLFLDLYAEKLTLHEHISKDWLSSA